MSERGSGTVRSSGDGRGTADTARLVVAAVLVVLLVLFGIANTGDATVDYLVGDSDAPLIIVMLLSAILGALIAALVHRRRS